MADLKQLLVPVLAELKSRLDAATDDDAKKDARADFLDAVKDAAPDLYNAVHSVGFASGRIDGTKIKGKADARVQAAEAKVTELEAALEAAKAEKPDVVAIETKWKAKLDKVEQALATKDAEYTATERKRAFAEAKQGLINALEEKGLSKRAAKYRVAELIDDGFVVQTDDGQVEFRQLKDKESTYPVPRGDGKAWDGLVKDVRASADPADVISNVDRGGGGNRSPGGGMPRGGQIIGPHKLPENVSAEHLAAKLSAVAG